MIRDICGEKSAMNLTFTGEILNTLSLRSGSRQGCPILPLLFNIILQVRASAIKARN